MPMKNTLQITCDLMERVCQLPGVAVLDWCDRASAAVSSLHTPSGAAVAVGRTDELGNLITIENSGGAWCGSAAEIAADGIPENPLKLEQVRESFQPGVQVGWVIGQLSAESRVTIQKAVPAISRRAASRLNRSWDPLANCDLVLGHCPIPGGPTSRRLFVELAAVNSTPEHLVVCQSVLTAVLPRIAARFYNAMGAENPDRSDWLTSREEAILWRLVAGKKVPQIAAELHRSIYTIHDHVKSLHRKLGASNRGQLVSRALGHLGPLVAEAAEGAGDDEDSSASSPRRTTLVP